MKKVIKFFICILVLYFGLLKLNDYIDNYQVINHSLFYYYRSIGDSVTMKQYAFQYSFLEWLYIPAGSLLIFFLYSDFMFNKVINEKVSVKEWYRNFQFFSMTGLLVAYIFFITLIYFNPVSIYKFLSFLQYTLFTVGSLISYTFLMIGNLIYSNIGYKLNNYHKKIDIDQIELELSKKKNKRKIKPYFYTLFVFFLIGLSFVSYKYYTIHKEYSLPAHLTLNKKTAFDGGEDYSWETCRIYDNEGITCYHEKILDNYELSTIKFQISDDLLSELREVAYQITFTYNDKEFTLKEDEYSINSNTITFNYETFVKNHQLQKESINRINFAITSKEKQLLTKSAVSQLEILIHRK